MYDSNTQSNDNATEPGNQLKLTYTSTSSRTFNGNLEIVVEQKFKKG
jgi:hypothetical protein